MDLERRLGERAESLTPSERRIGETILASPQLVAFGTVADVADATHVGTATVVRFAVKLGFDGYSQLQASVQGDVSGQLRPAVERIRDQRVGDDTLATRHAEVEIANVRSTLDTLASGTVARWSHAWLTTAFRCWCSPELRPEEWRCSSSVISDNCDPASDSSTAIRSTS